MNIGSLVTPWLMLAAVLVPLVYAERWIHSHLFGVAWLATNSTRGATALYYVLLLPGVFVHEFTQYLVAGALNVPIERVIAWPEAQEDGTLRLNFVQDKGTRRVPAAIIGAAPMLTGLAIVGIISNHVLNLDAVLQALSTADLAQIGPALRDMVGRADFFLWLYLMFAVSNAMLPTPADRRGWPLLLALFAGALVFLVLIGVGEVLLEVATTSLAAQIERLAAALATVVFVELLAIVFIGFVEEVLERGTKRKFTYNREEAPTRHRTRTRLPGSSAPLPPGAVFPSIYNLELPVPLPTETRVSAARQAAPDLSVATPAAAEGHARRAEERPPAPAIPAAGGRPRSRPSRPDVPPTRVPPVDAPSPRGADRPAARVPHYDPAADDRTAIGGQTGIFRAPSSSESSGARSTTREPMRPAETSSPPPDGGPFSAHLPPAEDREAPVRPAAARAYQPLRPAPTLPQDEEPAADDDADDELEYLPFDDVDFT